MGALLGHRGVARHALGRDHPVRTIAIEQQHGRLEQAGVVQAAGIDRVAVVEAVLSAEAQAATGRARITRSLSAPEGATAVLSRGARDRQRRGGKAHERNEARARSLAAVGAAAQAHIDRKSTRLNSSHSQISYAVFCLKKTCSPS